MERDESLRAFVTWCGKFIKGDEKGEAQLFLDRLFQAFGHAGLKEAGATLEMRVQKGADAGTAFADLVWKPVVLFEMKKRGEPLQKHYGQAFDYWTRLVPDRPRYVILCNFDEFRIYDFERQMDTPVDTVTLADLPDRWGSLVFLAPGSPAPTFGNDQVAVTRQAADGLAVVFRRLVGRGVERPVAQRFVLQVLVSFFAEDIGLLEKYTVANLLNECDNGKDTYDLLGGLFEAMNTAKTAVGGRFKGIPYFNGGLFAVPTRLELTDGEIVLLREAAKYRWENVRPEIFGTLFEGSLEKPERHAFGAHFTHPTDIMKIVGPTIVQPWREQIEGAKTATRLHELLDRLHRFKVLDPACGSGNFLYISYRELKRLEARLYERIQEFPSKGAANQLPMSFLTAQNFFGLDINPFAVEIAKVTMMIARKLAVDELHITEPALPLDNLDRNFVARDALLDTEGNSASWPSADVIIGNPPFLGAKRLKPERGVDYVNTLRKAYADVPGMADYCVYWLRKAQDALPACTKADPVAGRAGLVGTQNIRNNRSRVGGLDYIVAGGTIVEAVDNQPWSGEANVHVSIANWAKTKDAALLPKTKRLWFKVSAGKTAKRRRGAGSAAKDYELNFRESPFINSALSDETDVVGAVELACNVEPSLSYNGQMLGHSAFLLTSALREQLVSKEKKTGNVIYPYLNGREFLTGRGIPDRFVLDFGTRDQLQAAAFTAAFEHIQRTVLPDRERKAKEGVDRAGEIRPHHKQFLSRWWQLSFGRPELIGKVSVLPRYLVCSLVSKRQIFVFVSSGIRPSNLLQVFTLADDYSFGVMQSAVHWEWFKKKSSKLKSDYRFGESVWNTFPWPQGATIRQIDAVAGAGREVRRVRAESIPRLRGGLRALYRTLDLPGANPLKDAHAALDAAVMDAYGFSAKKDLLAQLLDLNLAVAARIEGGEKVVSPGVPADYPHPTSLISDDCIRASA